MRDTKQYRVQIDLSADFADEKFTVEAVTIEPDDSQLRTETFELTEKMKRSGNIQFPTDSKINLQPSGMPITVELLEPQADTRECYFDIPTLSEFPQVLNAEIDRNYTNRVSGLATLLRYVRTSSLIRASWNPIMYTLTLKPIKYTTTQGETK
jgi:hypothetical protein